MEDRAGRVLLGLILLVALLSAGLVDLRIDSRIQALLPPDNASVQSLETLNERAQASSLLQIFVASSDIRWNRRLAHEIAEALREWPDVRTAVTAREVDYFASRRLLFLETEDLMDAVDDIEARVEWEQCASIPGCINFDDRPEWPDTDEMVENVRGRPEYRGLPSLREREEAERLSPSDDGAWSTAVPGELCATDESMCAVEAVMGGSPGEIAYARDVYARTHALLDELEREGAPADLRIELNGRFRNVPLEYELTTQDLGRVGVLSALLILFLCWLQFRKPRALLLLSVPMVMSLLITLGLVGLFDPKLNLLSSFTFAIFAGLGVDFGLHLLTHYGGGRAGGLEPADALRSSYRELSGTMIAAAVTTGAAFLALTLSDFHGFAQMGRLAGLGIFSALMSYLLIFPPLVLLCHRWVPESGSVLRAHPTPLLRFPKRFRVAGLILLAGGAIFGLAQFERLEFEHNFRNLRPAEVGHGISAPGAFHGARGVRVYMLADSTDELERVVSEIREAVTTDDEAPLLVSARTFIPDQQVAKLDELSRLRDVLEDIRTPEDAADARQLERVRRWASHREPITSEGLPDWARAWLTERDGRFGHLAVLYLRRSGANAQEMEALSERIQAWRAEHPGVVFASPAALLGELIPILRNDAPGMLGFALGALLLVTGILARSWRRLLDVTVALVLLGGLATAGMVLLGIKLHMYNLLVVPLAFGIGVDGAIYLVWAARNQAKVPPTINADVQASARGVLWSTLTTVGGFGALLICVNPGLVSLGMLALVALAGALIANLVGLPNWLNIQVDSPANSAEQ